MVASAPCTKDVSDGPPTTVLTRAPAVAGDGVTCTIAIDDGSLGSGPTAVVAELCAPVADPFSAAGMMGGALVVASVVAHAATSAVPTSNTINRAGFIGSFDADPGPLSSRPPDTAAAPSRTTMPEATGVLSIDAGGDLYHHRPDTSC
jgi:hypothetical protein